MYVKFRPSIHTYYFVYRCNQTRYIYISYPFLSVSDRKNLKTYHVYQIIFFVICFTYLYILYVTRMAQLYEWHCILQHNSIHVMNKTKKLCFFSFWFCFHFLKKNILFYFLKAHQRILLSWMKSKASSNWFI